MAHEYFKEMLTTHALSALDRGDEQALEEHLATCKECMKELDQWCATAATMSLAGVTVEPTPEVRERLMARIRAERATPSNVVPLVPKTRVAPRTGSLLPIAAALIIGVLLISVFLLWRENQTIQAEFNREREIVAFLTRPGARLAELSGTKAAPGAYAKLAYDKNGRAMLMAKGLPAAPSGQAYQLWFIVGDNKMPGRTFGTDATGKGELNDEIPSAALSGAVFAVTLEPAGGSITPTGDIFLVSGS
jgi:anti-sigma-K factor RskA